MCDQDTRELLRRIENLTQLVESLRGEVCPAQQQVPPPAREEEFQAGDRVVILNTYCNQRGRKATVQGYMVKEIISSLTIDLLTIFDRTKGE